MVSVYSTTSDDGKGYVDQHYAIEVAVKSVKKGKAEKTIFVKAWQARKRPDGWVGESGHDTIPSPGQTVRLYLKGGNGSYEPLKPNGIEVIKLKKTTPK